MRPTTFFVAAFLAIVMAAPSSAQSTDIDIKATDGVMNSDYCVALDEAENRLHVQKAVMLNLLEL